MHAISGGWTLCKIHTISDDDDRDGGHDDGSDDDGNEDHFNPTPREITNSSSRPEGGTFAVHASTRNA